ncbi:MAG: glycosyltransferase family 4 protein [Opitutaceae bacterium]|nr:glycosyltransferase family 4 protein [Opitutaceae bacterium]
MTRPRVIFVNRVYWPSEEATAQLLTDLAEGLAGGGWPVDVIAAGDGGGERNGVRLHRTGPGDRHAGLLSRIANYRRFTRAAAAQVAALARRGDIVVPLTDPPMLGAAVASAAAARGARVVPWVQDIYPEIVSAHLGALLSLPLLPLRRRRDAAWRAAARVVVLGTDMARQVAARGVPAGRIAVVPNWAPRELDAPASPAAIAARRQAWGLPGGFVVAYSGNLGRVHEFATVLDAAALLRDRPDLTFLFIGRGARFEQIRAAAARQRLGNVRLLPPEPRAQLAAALAAADVHLVTLRPAFARLVYPSKLAGVLAAGRPVAFVGPTDGDIARLLADGPCGVAVAPGEAGPLAAALRRWRDAPDLARAAGERGRRAYERQLTFARALARWTAVLEEAARS